MSNQSLNRCINHELTINHMVDEWVRIRIRYVNLYNTLRDLLLLNDYQMKKCVIYIKILLK